MHQTNFIQFSHFPQHASTQKIKSSTNYCTNFQNILSKALKKIRQKDNSPPKLSISERKSYTSFFNIHHSPQKISPQKKTSSANKRNPNNKPAIFQVRKIKISPNRHYFLSRSKILSKQRLQSFKSEIKIMKTHLNTQHTLQKSECVKKKKLFPAKIYTKPIEDDDFNEQSISSANKLRKYKNNVKILPRFVTEKKKRAFIQSHEKSLIFQRKQTEQSTFNDFSLDPW